MKAWISPGMWVVLLVVAMVVSGCVEEVGEEIDVAPDAVETENEDSFFQNLSLCVDVV